MEKQYYNEYPYGKFPTNFTKNGQKKYFESLNTENNQPQVTTMSTPTKENQPQSSFDVAKLLPLLKMMGDKKSISNTDMLQIFLPLLGGNSSNIGEIMSLLNPPKNSGEDIAEDIPLSNTTKIDEYKRIE